jgi:hypothetical protein
VLSRNAEGFRLSDEPTRASVDLLVISLREDHVTRSVSPKNHAHRSGVIRQQSELLEQRAQVEALGFNKPEAKRL